MSFVVEDGTGLENANSYASVSFADSYFEDRGNTIWAAATDDAKEQALVRATDYLDNRFTFKGDPLDEDQALQFPIHDEDDPDAEQVDLPNKLKQATCEYALRALSATLAPDPVVDDSGLLVTSKTEKVGPIEESTTYSDARAVQPFKPYPAADMLLRGLVQNNSNRVIR